MKIAHKINFLFLIILVSIAVMGFLTINIVKNELNKTILADIDDKVDEQFIIIEIYMNDKIEIVKELIHRKFVIDVLKQSNEQFAKKNNLESYIQNYDWITNKANLSLMKKISCFQKSSAIV
jgi:hypothetical protein